MSASHVVRLAGNAGEPEIRAAVERAGTGLVEIYLGIEPSGTVVGVADRRRAEDALRAVAADVEIVHLDLHARPIVLGVLHR